MKSFILLALPYFLVACTTGQVQKEGSHTFSHEEEADSLPAKSKARFSELNYKIDYSGLENYLKLQDRKTTLGMQSADFNSCKAGYGFSRNEPCYDLTMSVIRFKLQCRDSEGTTDIVQTEYNVQPISNTKLNWELSGSKKSLRTDSEGYGKIQIVTEGNPSTERLRLSNGRDFVYVRAKDIKRIVTPAPWCK